MTEPRARKTSRQEDAVDNEDDPFPGEAEQGPHLRFKDVFKSSVNDQSHSDSDYDQGVSVDVTHYILDKSIRHKMILLSLSNSKLGIRLHLLRAVVFGLGCLLYVGETVYYDYFTETGAALNDSQIVDVNSTAEWLALEAKTLVLLSEDKPYPLWALQVLISLLILFIALMSVYISTSWAWQTLLKSVEFSLVIIIVVPLMQLVTLTYPPVLRNLFIPSFLYCWPAGQAFTVAIIQRLQRSFHRRPNTFRLKAISIAILFLCFMFSWVCILHHFFRLDEQTNLFQTYYFLMVTMSTVGYGDISPNHWTGRMLVTVFILSALTYLIPQLQILYEAFQLQQKLHNTVGVKQVGENHILVCAKRLKPLVLRDFLTEFYSDPSHYDVHCVILVQQELSSVTQMHLRHPIWAQRITVLIGSPLRLSDLQRARAQSALTCFIHTSREEIDSYQADQYTIMCAWAVRDFSPKVKLCVQILHPENRLHLDVADHIVCEGELRNALLASHCLCPGVTTLVTLLLHTFKPERRALASEEYELYTECAPCEIYDSKLGDSKYFHHFHGKNFLYTAVVAFRKYHVTLLGVRPYNLNQILLNPGLDYVMNKNDICYYIGITREEYSEVGGATSIHHALQQSCAKVAVYSLAVCGLDPHNLDELKIPEDKPLTKRPSAASLTKHQSVVSMDEPDGPTCAMTKNKVSFFIPNMETCDVSIDSDVHLQVLEARRGLHLLKYHSSLDMHANPVVKVSLSNYTCVQSHGQVEQTNRNNVQVLSGSQSHEIQDDHLRAMETLVVNRKNSVDGVVNRRLFQRSISEGSHITHRSPSSPKPVFYTSNLSLLESQQLRSSPHLDDSSVMSPLIMPMNARRPSVWSTMTRTSRISLANLDVSGPDVLELELADIKEEEELEGLEDGYCEDQEVSSSRSPSPALAKEHGGAEEVPQRRRYDKGPMPGCPYLGFEAPNCHILTEQRTPEQVVITGGSGFHWQEGVVIVYADSVNKSLYHFVLPLRANYLPTSAIRPLVIMLKSKPPVDFVESIAWLPLVYYIIGDFTVTSDWLQAGISKADSVVILGTSLPALDPEHELYEHMMDAPHVMTVQKLAKLFPHVNIISELHFRCNIRFMRYMPTKNHSVNFKALMRKGDHLTYLFLPQVASGQVFCPSMLDTLLYQVYTKPYIIDLVRQLVGCKEVSGSGFLWHVPLSEELLELKTYERVFQRLVTTHRYIPLGIHRSVPVDSCDSLLCEGVDPCNHDSYLKREGIQHFLDSQMKALGLEGMRGQKEHEEGSQSFVLPNPPPKTLLKTNDIILVLRSHSSPLPHHDATPTSPLSHHDATPTSPLPHHDASLVTSSRAHSLSSSLHDHTISSVSVSDLPLSFKCTSSPISSGPSQPEGVVSDHCSMTVVVPIECYTTETNV